MFYVQYLSICARVGKNGCEIMHSGADYSLPLSLLLLLLLLFFKLLWFCHLYVRVCVCARAHARALFLSLFIFYPNFVTGHCAVKLSRKSIKTLRIVCCCHYYDHYYCGMTPERRKCAVRDSPQRRPLLDNVSLDTLPQQWIGIWKPESCYEINIRFRSNE
jgi:hypothetical protein